MRDHTRRTRAVIAMAALGALGACADGFDGDFRSIGNGFDTTEAVQSSPGVRPQPDNRGVISYPSYQVAIARRGDTVEDVASRIGIPADELASFNGLPMGVPLRNGEIVALPRRVAEPSPATGAIATGPILPAGQVDVAGVAGSAIERAEWQAAAQPTIIPGAPTGEEPIRHQVQPGETAFTIARLYDVNVRTLADWNGLGPDLDVRPGQFLLIPVAVEVSLAPATATAPPGRGSRAPAPPSAARPLPTETPAPAAAAAAAAPESPAMAEDATAASDTARFAMPVSGSIINAYRKDVYDGIGIGASGGTAVSAADDGTVAAITVDQNGVPVIALRHEGNLLTIYAQLQDITVEVGDTVRRGQSIAAVRSASPSFLHFEVRDGFESVDPMLYLN